MKLTYPVGNLIRFDVNIYNLNKDIPLTIDSNAAYGLGTDNDGKLSVGIICRYKIFSIDQNNDELIGYVRESESNIVEFNDAHADLPILIKFCSDAFINVELDFQERMQLPYNIFGYIRPSFDKIGQSLLNQLVDAGFYKSIL